MKPELILRADILDIIFEHRNKEYGAYALRKEYNGRMKKSISAVFILTAAIFALNSWNKTGKNNVSSRQMIIPDSLVITHADLKPRPPVEPPKQNIASKRHVAFVLTNDSTADTIATVEDLDKGVKIGFKTQDGEPSLNDAPPAESTSESTPAKAKSEGPKQEEKVWEKTEIMPEFPGGQAAFMRFLSKNLKVPEGGLEPGQRLKILVRFVVGKEGELSQVEFLQTSGEEVEREVTRVLNKMPKWKPGVQNGEKVSVYFTLPVIFEVPE